MVKSGLVPGVAIGSAQSTFYQRFLGHRADPVAIENAITKGRPSDCLTPTFRFSSHAVAPILVWSNRSLAESVGRYFFRRGRRVIDHDGTVPGREPDYRRLLTLTEFANRASGVLTMIDLRLDVGAADECGVFGDARLERSRKCVGN
jgi:hypothetical protein